MGKNIEEEKMIDAEIVVKFVKDNCGLSVVNEQSEFYEASADF